MPRRFSSRRGGLHNAWVLSLASVAVIGVLVALLWALGQRRPRGVGEDRELVVYCAAGIAQPTSVRPAMALAVAKAAAKPASCSPNAGTSNENR